MDQMKEKQESVSVRRQLRRAALDKRGALSAEQRERMSEQAVRLLAGSEEFQNAQTVMLYAHTKAELSLDALARHPLASGKRFVYPLCISKTEMVALLPADEEAWKEGAFGIREPRPERSERIAPESIDLVVCPCSAFDENCNRMGMGAGFYDRYLPKCSNAVICAVAFEAQKLPEVPVDAWDVPMEMVFTEKTVYRRNAPENIKEKMERTE